MRRRQPAVWRQWRSAQPGMNEGFRAHVDAERRTPHPDALYVFPGRHGQGMTEGHSEVALNARERCENWVREYNAGGERRKAALRDKVRIQWGDGHGFDVLRASCNGKLLAAFSICVGFAEGGNGVRRREAPRGADGAAAHRRAGPRRRRRESARAGGRTATAGTGIRSDDCPGPAGGRGEEAGGGETGRRRGAAPAAGARGHPRAPGAGRGARTHAGTRPAPRRCGAGRGPGRLGGRAPRLRGGQGHRADP